MRTIAGRGGRDRRSAASMRLVRSSAKTRSQRERSDRTACGDEVRDKSLVDVEVSFVLAEIANLVSSRLWTMIPRRQRRALARTVRGVREGVGY